MEGFHDPRYFDYAASSLPWQESIEAYTSTSKEFYANPSSNHIPGKEAKQKLLGLKKEFCDLLHFYDGRLLSCSSGSEANNTIIEGHLKAFPNGRLLIAEDVHESVWYAVEKYKKAVEVLEIDPSGRIPLDKFEEALRNKITLVCVSHVCNETGTIHPIEKLADLCFKRQIRILIDGAQSVGHLPLDLNTIPFNYFTFSGQKFGSIKSTGGILFRDDAFRSLIQGGKQQWNLRAGTEDLAGLSAMTVALKQSSDCITDETIRLRSLKQLILEPLKEIPNLIVNSPEDGVPWILSVSIPGYSGREIVSGLSMAGFAISTGSACHESELEPSRIIMAMGRNNKEAIGSIRLSMGMGTTEEAVKDLTHALLDLVK